MKTVGVRELEEHLGEMLHQVHETGEIIAVTKDGEVIAHLVSASIPQWLAELPHEATAAHADRVKTETDASRSNTTNTVDDVRDVWTNFDHLVAELGIHWPKGVSAVDAIRDVRREL